MGLMPMGYGVHCLASAARSDSSVGRLLLRSRSRKKPAIESSTDEDALLC